MEALNNFFSRLSVLSADALLRAGLMLLLGYIGVRLAIGLLRRALGKTSLDISLSRTLLSACRFTLYLVLLVSCLNQLGISSTSLVALLGTFGLALSLAMQDTLANIAGGIFVMYTKPFRVGDYIAVCGVEGTVQALGFIHTTLATIDNKLIYIPNGQLSKDTIVNFSGDSRRQLEMDIGIGYQDDSAAARLLISQVVAADKRVDHTAPIFVKVWSLGPSAVNIKVRAWVPVLDLTEARCDLYEQVKDALLQNGFHIPYPQTQVHWQGPDAR